MAISGPISDIIGDYRAFARTQRDRLAARGIDIETLPFEGSYGRTSMEYYDGFVFGFDADPALNIPPVATGGRYDALTRVLGAGTGVPAVGGVIRPALVAQAEGAT